VKPLLTLADVGKDYAKVATDGSRLRLVWDLLRRNVASDVFPALSGVSFEMQRGASLGIIGENGAGKSTLLKIIAGVIQPTRGSVEVNGRVSALLELGSGFHPEYTGLANIDLSAALLGLPPDEIAGKREEIVAFADIGDHINEPIKHYSSGMVVRLGFAVATVLRPDLLITDEVLAVGDESFQKKCVAWIERFLSENGTLLLCSHSLYHIQKLCRNALWLQNGRVMRYGAADEVTQAYHAYHEEKSAAAKQPIQPELARAAGFYAIRRFEIASGETIANGAEFVLTGEAFSPDGRPPAVLIGISRADGTSVYGVSTEMDGVTTERLGPDRFGFSLTLPALSLLPAKYTVRAHALDPEGMRLFDTIELPFFVTGSAREYGTVRLEHRWGGARHSDATDPA
jgi:lipopolysaccharide transport system ATP-binding protein